MASHKSNIFKTPEKDDTILAASHNISPTAQYLDISDMNKRKNDHNIDFIRRTDEVFMKERILSKNNTGKMLIRLDFGKRDLISSLFGYPSSVEKYKLVQGKLLSIKC